LQANLEVDVHFNIHKFVAGRCATRHVGPTRSSFLPGKGTFGDEEEKMKKWKPRMITRSNGPVRRKQEEAS